MLLDGLGDASVVLLESSSNRVVTVGEIRALADRISQSQRGLAFLVADGSAESASWMLALLEARYPVALIDSENTWDVMGSWVEGYSPDLVVDPAGRMVTELASSGHGARGRLVEPTVWRTSVCGSEPHADLAVLLTTSGSTGSPKFVRLSAANIRANAEQISQALGISSDDRGVTALPMFYSFGMSILTSHALAGSPVLVTQASVLEESFWPDLELHGVSFLAGVPTTYAMLKRLGFEKRNLPRLRALTQAGGRLSPELVSYFHDVMARRGGRFFVMYGQTEASPRMTCLPSERLPEKLGSVGLALAGGELSIRGQDGDELAVGEVGEVAYKGPNVMMGYAESRADLIVGATQPAVLATGDLGYLDEDGFLFLTGRSRRICKLAGTRMSLDEIEAVVTRIRRGDGQVAAVDRGDAGVSIFATDLDAAAGVDLRRGVARSLRVPPKFIDVRSVDSLPMLTSGKVDYATLVRSLETGVA